MRVDPVSQVCPLKCRLSEGEKSDHVVSGERFYFDIILDMKL